MGKKHPYYEKSMSINSQTFPIPWVLLHFPILWEIAEETHAFSNAEVYHRKGIGWEKASILWEKYEYQFPWLSPYHDFCCIFPYCGEFMGEPMHFPHDDIGYFFSVNSSNYILLPSCYF